MNKRPLVAVFENNQDQTTAKTSVFENNSICPIDVNTIDFFEGNPRTIRSPEKWAELKESVRARGVLYPIQVARRTGTNRFVVARGGNSRLGVLKELFEETGDVKFKYIPAQEVTYKDEDELFIFHLIENEQRSEMMFWDRAQSYYKLCLRLGMSESTPLRQIEENLHAVGLSMSHVRLSHFMFAVTKLTNLKELAHYLSGSKTIDLRKIYTELGATSRDFGIDDIQFNEFWNQQLTEFATNENGVEDLNVSRLTTAIKDAFRLRWPQAEHAPKHNSKQQSAKSSQSSNPDAATDNQSFDGAPIQQQPFENTSASDDRNLNALSASENQKVEQAAHNHVQEIHLVTKSIDSRPATEPLATESQNQFIEHGATPLSLQSAIAKLANYANIEDAVIFDDVFPLGFWIEVPEFSGTDNLVDGEIAIDTRSIVARSVWWFLLMLTEQSEREKDTLYMLPDESLIKQCILDDNMWYDLMLTKVGMVETGYVEHWLRTESEEFVELVLDVFKCLRRMS